MSESMVDNEGFPRTDVDIWQVRTARHKIISKFKHIFCQIIFFTNTILSCDEFDDEEAETDSGSKRGRQRACIIQSNCTDTIVSHEK